MEKVFSYKNLGIYTYSNGEKYAGDWINGKMNGEGNIWYF